MPVNRPQTRFLLRGSALLIVLLAIWWFVLLNPLLSLLRGSVELLGGLVPGGGSSQIATVNPAGDWGFQAPLRAADGKSVLIEFNIPRADLLIFTFSLPVYWALILAAGGIRRSARPLLVGTGVMVVLETILVLAVVRLAASKVAAQMPGFERPDDVAQWLQQFCNYLIVSVIPYAAPFVLAIALQRDLRSRIFHWGNAEPASEQAAVALGAGGKFPRSRKQRKRDDRQASRPEPGGR